MYKILIVDDDPRMIHLLRIMLNMADFQVLTAESGQEGLNLARQELPDVIILDARMPHIDGFTVCETLCHEPATSHIPIVMLSAYAYIKEGLEAGASAYLMKPVPRNLLIDTIRDALRYAQINRWQKKLLESDHFQAGNSTYREALALH